MGRYRESGSDYSPFEDDYRGFEIREDDTARGPLILALAIGVLLVFGAVVWNTYRQGVRSNGAGIPSVIAEKQPYKRAPEDRGGVAVPDVNKRFYDQMDASDRSEEEMRDYASRSQDEESGEMLQGGPPIELRPGQEREMDDSDPENGMPNAVADQVRALAELDDRPGEPQDSVEVASNAPVELPTTRQLPPAPVAQTSQFAFTDGGTYLVQLAAFRSQDAAETAWSKATTSRPDLYRGARKQVQRADLGAKGVFYRLRVGSFVERAEASAFCDAVKASGENCIVVTG